MAKYANWSDFAQHFCMSILSSNMLLSFMVDDFDCALVDEKITSHRVPPITPKIKLYPTLQYLTGGSYSPIHFLTGMSTSSFYCVVWKTIRAINTNGCNEVLEFLLSQTIKKSLLQPRDFRVFHQMWQKWVYMCIWNVVLVIDGYHLQMHIHPKAQVRSFYSWHYHSYGMNVQAGTKTGVMAGW